MSRFNTRRFIQAAALCVGPVLMASGPAAADQVFNDDVIIEGSLCVGFDCANGMNFGFDTIVLQENNLRILFNDTSNSGSFPNNDWRLTANDSSNGGGNFFSIDDATAGRQILRLTAGARSNSIFVSSPAASDSARRRRCFRLHVPKATRRACACSRTAAPAGRPKPGMWLETKRTSSCAT